MKHILVVWIALLACSSVPAKEPSRPRILGIAYVRIFSSDPKSAEKFYAMIPTMKRERWQEGRALSVCAQCDLSDLANFRDPDEQVVLIKDDSASPQNRIDQIVFEISNARKMERYMISRGVAIRSSTPRLEYFDVLDPEGHRIGFVQRSRTPENKGKHSSLVPLIHAGLVVRDRAAMDKFYKDILGFRPYWRGGMKDDQTDWVSLQVPDGTDWVEFMVNVPLNADRCLLGVMNHIALGVPDIHAAAKQLLTNGMKLTEEPKIGRDGKWQLNLYDPDQTRVELMEFTPVEKPCCSDYTDPHPKP